MIKLPAWRDDPRRNCATFVRDFIHWQAPKQQKVCAGCPFTQECKQWALDNYELSELPYVIVHGGMTGPELLTERRAAAPAGIKICRRGHARPSTQWRCGQCNHIGRKERKLTLA